MPFHASLDPRADNRALAGAERWALALRWAAALFFAGAWMGCGPGEIGAAARANAGGGAGAGGGGNQAMNDSGVRPPRGPARGSGYAGPTPPTSCAAFP